LSIDGFAGFIRLSSWRRRAWWAVVKATGCARTPAVPCWPLGRAEAKDPHCRAEQPPERAICLGFRSTRIHLRKGRGTAGGCRRGAGSLSQNQWMKIGWPNARTRRIARRSRRRGGPPRTCCRGTCPRHHRGSPRRGPRPRSLETALRKAGSGGPTAIASNLLLEQCHPSRAGSSRRRRMSVTARRPYRRCMQRRQAHGECRWGQLSRRHGSSVFAAPEAPQRPGQSGKKASSTCGWRGASSFNTTPASG
jgi:hypothetical protein